MCELLGPDDREDNEQVASCQEALGGKEIVESWKKCGIVVDNVARCIISL